MLVIATSMGGLQNGALALTVFAAAMFVSNMALTAAATSVFAVSKLRALGTVSLAGSGHRSLQPLDRDCVDDSLDTRVRH